MSVRNLVARTISTNHWAVAAAIVLSALIPKEGLSQNKNVWDNYSEAIPRATVQPLGDNLFGDKVEFYTGRVEFVQPDVQIPGNSGLPVGVSRRFALQSQTRGGIFGDWDIDIPHMKGIFKDSGPGTIGWQASMPGQPNRRCSVDKANYITGTPPVVAGTNGGFFSSAEYWSNNSLHVPGEGEQTLVVLSTANQNKPSDGNEYYWATESGWVFSCLPSAANGTPGEAFVATSPAGVKYQFDWFVTHIGPRRLQKPITVCTVPMPDCFSTIDRREVRILPTLVTDAQGNWVKFTYDPLNPERLLSITSDDLRQISLMYGSNGKVSTVVANGRTWFYTYNAAFKLTDVTLPDGSKWTFSMPPPEMQPTESALHSDCTGPAGNPSGSALAHMTHPSGAVGDFSFVALRHARSYVPRLCVNVPGGGSYAGHSPVADAMSLTKKQISGPGIPESLIWNFEYSPGNLSPQHWNFDTDCVSFACPTTKTTTVSRPNGDWTRYTISNKFNYLEGRVLSEEVGSGATVLRTTAFSYQTDPAGQLYPQLIGRNPCHRCDKSGELLQPIKQRSVTQQGEVFTRQTTQFDAWARPIREVHSSTLGDTRTEDTAYHDNTAKWVIGQVARIRNVNLDTYTTRTEFDTTTALPLRFYTPGTTANPGLLNQTLTYNADGTLATVKDGNNKITTLSNWYRGIPRTIKYADATTQTAVVNASGWITSITDQNGFQTNYTYDAMGRLASIVYPTGDAVAWNQTTLSFAKTTATEVGFPAGTWRQQVQTGNGIHRTYFDALWRPLLTHEYDSGLQTATQRFNAWKYDHEGRTAFTAYPLAAASSVNSFIYGVDTFYDALGRVTAVAQDSELGTLTTTTAYLADFQTRVTNPRGKVTTTSYFAWDQPDYTLPRVIQAPEGATTTIARDAIGMPTSVTRSGTWAGAAISRPRTYYYDTYRRLMRTYVPEEGTTGYRYDNAGNLTRTMTCASNSQASCDAVAAGEHTVRTYDAMNRLDTLSYPDGINNADYGYTPDGLLATLNVADPASGGIHWTYTYNKRRLLTKENLFFYSNYYTDFVYNGNGHLAGAGHGVIWVDYAPNALGQPTQAGTYATGVQYHPNGAVKQFTYGNGIVHTMTQNLRQLPDISRDVYGSTKYLDIDLGFDANGNVASSVDLAPPGHSRTMSYDALDRLTGVGNNQLWTGASYSYDPLDNLRSAQLVKTTGTDTLTYSYHATTNRLTQVARAGQAAWTYSHDARGNVTADGRNNYTWTRANRLAAATGKESYQYDGHGRRVVIWRADGSASVPMYGLDGKLRLTADNGLGGATYHVYLGDDNVADVFSRWSDGLQTATYLHTDALGSPVVRTNQARNVTGRTVYAPYGETVSTTGTTPANRIDYTGHAKDGATGLVYMQQRYYDPAIGRFLSVDPVAANGNSGANFNRYWYANNNPYSFIDPDGRRPNKAGATDSTFIAGDIGRATDLWALSEQFNRFENRYFYTKKFGWVDAKHFFAAAHLERQYRFDGFARAAGVLVEIDQKLSESSSAFSPEDLPSNEAGIDFGNSYRKGESVRDAFVRWAAANGAMTGGNFKQSPEYKALPASEPSGEGVGSMESSPDSNSTKEPPVLGPHSR